MDTEANYKNKMGLLLTKGLFFETANQVDTPMYSLKDTDHTIHGKTYPSLYRLYMEAADLTEYEFAKAHLHGWEQWTRLLECNWFKPYIQRWRTELELKIKAEALRRIFEEAREGGKNSYNANKFFVERGYIDKSVEPSRRGRPTKAEISRRAAEEVFGDNIVKDAIKRLEVN